MRTSHARHRDEVQAADDGMHPDADAGRADPRRDVEVDDHFVGELEPP